MTSDSVGPIGPILVTGAQGYLGGRLVAHLRQQGHRLRLTSRRPPPSASAADPEAVWMPGDLLDGGFVRRAVEGVKAVIHLASPNEIESEAHPLRAVEVTIGGTAQLVSAAAAAGVERFVYLSTAHVYGAPLAGRLDESSPTRPVHPYAITHRAAEDFVLAAGRAPRSRLEPVVIRLSNAVGPPTDASVDRWSLLANDLCRQAVTERRLVLKSAGLQPRDFVPMSDVCRAIEHLLLIPADRLGDGRFNVGAGQSLRVIDLAERIQRLAAAVLVAEPPLVRPDPGSTPPAPALHFDVSRLLASGFVPEGSLDRELEDTLRFCQSAFAARG